jgi:predicted amidohydrolase
MAFADPITLKVAAVQFRSSFEIDDNAGRIIRILNDLADEGVDVAVFPECALTGFHKDSVMDCAAREVIAAESRIQDACRKKSIAAVFGSIYKINNKTYNSAVVFDSHGNLVERYGKLLAGEPWATRGNHIALFELEGVLSTVIVCNDERYPEFVRLPAMAGAKIIYYISHEAGMQKEWKFAGYRAQMMARAVENGMFAVCANAPADLKDATDSHGQSRIIHKNGNVLKEASFYGEDILIESITIDPDEPIIDWLEKTLNGLMGEWWRQGVEKMMENRHKKLE